jgi:hypothetical protein
MLGTPSSTFRTDACGLSVELAVWRVELAGPRVELAGEVAG